MDGEKPDGRGSSSLSAYLRVLRRRKWIVITCAVLVPAVAVLLSLRQTPQYQSSAEVYINKQNIASALTGITDTTLFVDEQRAADTQASLASTPHVAEMALGVAGLHDRSADALVAQSSVTPKGLTDILEFTVTDPDPARPRSSRRPTRRRSSPTAASSTRKGSSAPAARCSAPSRAREGRPAEHLAVPEPRGEGAAAADAAGAADLARLRHAPGRRRRPGGADAGAQRDPRPRARARARRRPRLRDRRARHPRALAPPRSASGSALPLLARVPPPPKRLAADDRLVMLAQPTGPDQPRRSGCCARTSSSPRLEPTRRRARSSSRAPSSRRASRRRPPTSRSPRRARASGWRLVDLDLRRPYSTASSGSCTRRASPTWRSAAPRSTRRSQRIDLGLGRPVPADAAPLPRRASATAPRATSTRETGSLDVLVAGPLPPDPGEFVGTRRAARHPAGARAAATTLVIVDTPPVLRVGDALTLSRPPTASSSSAASRSSSAPTCRELRRAARDRPRSPKLGFVVTGSARSHGLRQPGTAYGYGVRLRPARRPRPAARKDGAARLGGAGRVSQVDATVDLGRAPVSHPPRRVALEDLVDERTRALIRSRRVGSTHRRGWLDASARSRRRRGRPAARLRARAGALRRATPRARRPRRPTRSRSVALRCSPPAAGSCSPAPTASTTATRSAPTTPRSTTSSASSTWSRSAPGCSSRCPALTGLADPSVPKLFAVLGRGDRARRARAASRRARSAGAPTPTSRTRSSSAPATSASGSRASCSSIPSTASTWSASSTSTRASATRDSASSPCSAASTSCPEIVRDARRRAGDRRVLAGTRTARRST